MGAAASALKFETVDLETLKQVTGSNFSLEVYNTYKLADGTFPRAKLIELSQLTDLFLTHNWGKDNANHLRVSKINDCLKSIGFITWFDGDRMQGNIVDQMTNGIDNAQLVIVFITKEYIEKVAQVMNKNDNCKREFNYSVNRKTSSHMISVVMEKDVLNTSTWAGSVGATLAGELYINFCDDSALEDNIKLLAAEITKRITPYGVINTSSVVGSSISSLKAVAESPVNNMSLDSFRQELVAWMINEVHFTPQFADKCAGVFLQNNVGTVQRLKRKALKDPAVLIQWEMDEMDAEELLDALRRIPDAATAATTAAVATIPYAATAAATSTNADSSIAAVSPSLSATAIGAVENTSTATVDESVLRDGSVTALVAALRECSAQDKAKVAEALKIRAQSVEGKKQIAAAGGIPVLVALARDGDTTGKAQAAVALWGLSFNNDENKKLIAEAGGIPVLVALARDGAAEEKTQAAKVLKKLAKDANCKKLIDEAGGIPS